MKIAIGANILMKNHARRMVLGAAECAGSTVVLPETAAIMAKLNYRKVSTRYAENVVVWNARRAREPFDQQVLAPRIRDMLRQICEGFAQWLDDEQQRNDGIFERAPSTTKSQDVAHELSLNRIVDDPKDTRWEIGEDPYVIAEALEAGAHWIASDNFNTLRPHAMENWLDRVQQQGRYLHAPRPFILSAEQALDMMLARTTEWERDAHVRASWRIALAHALSEPSDPATTIARRIGILARFAKDLRDCGMSTAGNDLLQWQIDAYVKLEQGQEQAAWHAIGKLQRLRPTREVQRTREAEDRRRQWERGKPPHLAACVTTPSNDGNTGP